MYEEIILKYNSSVSKDELFINYGNQILLSAFSIIFRLKIFWPSNLRLRIFGLYKKNYVDNFYYKTFHLVTLSLLFLEYEIKEHIKTNYHDILKKEDYEDIIVQSGLYFFELFKLEEDETRKEEFLRIETENSFIWDDNPDKKNIIFIHKMKEFYENNYRNHVKMDSKSFAKFFLPITTKNHLGMIFTAEFINNYRRLTEVDYTPW